MTPRTMETEQVTMLENAVQCKMEPIRLDAASDVFLGGDIMHNHAMNRSRVAVSF